MCEFNKKDMCLARNDKCPFVYFCDKIQDYKPMKSMPKDCNVKISAVAPIGYNKVAYERKGYLYVYLDADTIIKVKNTLNKIPPYIKLRKTSGGEYKIGK